VRTYTEAGHSHKPSLYQKYIDAGNWKCKKSPKGAHHWVIGEKGDGKCKHCDMEREFNATPMLQGDVHQLEFVPVE